MRAAAALHCLYHRGMQAVLQEMAERIRAAAAQGQPLRLRGGGSKDGYGQALEGALLDTRAYAGVIAYEPSELVVTVRCGTPLAELEELLAQHGQCLPFEPPHRLTGGAPHEATTGQATCGGMLAAGLSGPARASVGAVRDYVLGLRMVNGRGEVLQFGGQVMKNVAGYDVSRLMAGALGTLGLVAECSLKVLPRAPAEATLSFALRQREALDQLHRWGGQPLPLNASCWVPGDAPGEDPSGRLWLRLRGAEGAVRAARARMGGDTVGSDEAAAFWQARRDGQMPWPAAPGHDLWRLSLPQAAPVLHARTLVEWHGAQRWLSADPAQAGAVRAAARAAGGSATLLRPATPRDAAARSCFDPLPPALERIHRGLKASFDPAGVFNRGRLYPGW